MWKYIWQICNYETFGDKKSNWLESFNASCSLRINWFVSFVFISLNSVFLDVSFLLLYENMDTCVLPTFWVYLNPWACLNSFILPTRDLVCLVVSCKFVLSKQIKTKNNKRLSILNCGPETNCFKGAIEWSSVLLQIYAKIAALKMLKFTYTNTQAAVLNNHR